MSDGWRGRAGAWLGIGASPAALVLGVELADRHQGPVPLASLVLGLVVIVALLWGQGLLGLAAPIGHGEPFGKLTRRYLSTSGASSLNLLLAAAMMGWLGFNTALGAAAISSMAGVPHLLGVVVSGILVAIGYRGGMRRWNLVAIVTTSSSLALAALVVAAVPAPASPLTARAPRLSIGLADVASAAGYVAVFAARAPDFTSGLTRRADLARSIPLLVGPLTALVLAGALLHLGSGVTDVAATLTARGLLVGNLLIALAVVAPSFTTLHSGSLALTSVFPIGTRSAATLVFAVGMTLAGLGFHRHLLPWLALLAATIPAIIVAMALEGARRRKGSEAQVPLWTWGPAAVVALSANWMGFAWGPVAGLVLASVISLAWGRRRRPPGSRAA